MVYSKLKTTMDDSITATSPSDIKISKLDFNEDSDDFNEDSDDLLCDQSTHSPSIKKSRIKKLNTIAPNKFRKYPTNTLQNNSLTKNPLESIESAPSFSESAIKRRKLVHEQAIIIALLIEEAKFEGNTRCYLKVKDKEDIYPENRQLLTDKGYEIHEERSYLPSIDLHYVSDINMYQKHNSQEYRVRVYIDWSSEPNIGESPLNGLESFYPQYEKTTKLHEEASQVKKVIEKAQLDKKTKCYVDLNHEMDDDNIKALAKRGYVVKKPNDCLEVETPIYPHEIDWNYNDRPNPINEFKDYTVTSNPGGFTTLTTNNQAERIVNAIKKAQEKGLTSCGIKLRGGMHETNKDALMKKNYRVVKNSFVIHTNPPIHTYSISWDKITDTDNKNNQANDIIKNSIPDSPTTASIDREIPYPRPNPAMDPIGTNRPRRLIPDFHNPFDPAIPDFSNSWRYERRPNFQFDNTFVNESDNTSPNLLNNVYDGLFQFRF